MFRKAVIGAGVLLVFGVVMFAVGCSAPEQAAPTAQPAQPAQPEPAQENPQAAAPSATEEPAAEPAPAETAAVPEQPQKVFQIGMSQCNLGEPWRVQMNADIAEAAAKHPELKVTFKDAQNDTLRQRAHIEEFVSSGVDLLIVSPLEAAPLTEPIAKAYQAGIPVIVLDRRVIGDQYTVFIGADNKLIGKAAGDWIVKRLNGKGNVVELEGLMTSTPGQDRHSGFMDAIKGTGIDVIFTADMKWLEPNARKEMESALARYDNIDLVYAHNDPGAHGAYLAAKDAGRAKDIIFVGIDGLPQEGQAYVRDGILNACFEYPTGGREAIDTALKLLHGETVEKEIVLPSHFYTPENIAQGGQWLSEMDNAPSDNEAADTADVTTEDATDAEPAS